MLLALLALPRLVHGQAQTGPSNDPYAHFVGRWVGYEDYPSENGPVHVALVLVVTEEKHAKTMTLDYTFSSKGQKDYQHRKELMKLDPATQTVSMRRTSDTWLQDYQSDDLQKFAQTGYGRFTAIATGLSDGLMATWRGTFELQPDTFQYHWDTAKPGELYHLRGTYVLKREPATL